jgi:hypothetical protein
MMPIDAIPWDKILVGGGSATLIVAFAIYVLRHIAAQTKESNSTIKEVSGHVEKVAKSFEETATSIHKDCRESSERRETALHDLIKEHLRRSQG